MIVSIDKAVGCIVDYLGSEVAKIPNPIARWSTMFAIGAMGANPVSFADKARTLGILNADGMVDTDIVRSGFSMAFSNGGCLEALGMRFTSADGDELLRRLES